MSLELNLQLLALMVAIAANVTWWLIWREINRKGGGSVLRAAIEVAGYVAVAGLFIRVLGR